jgi:hypothetical protein
MEDGEVSGFAFLLLSFLALLLFFFILEVLLCGGECLESVGADVGCFLFISAAWDSSRGLSSRSW